VAELADRIDAVAIDRRRGHRAAFIGLRIEPAGIGVSPQLAARLGVEAEDRVDILAIAQRIGSPGGQCDAGEARPDRAFPEDLGPLRWPVPIQIRLG